MQLGGGLGDCETGPCISAIARPCLAALNLSPIKSPSLAGSNWARRAGSMWLLKMMRVEEGEEGTERRKPENGENDRVKMRNTILQERQIIKSLRWGRSPETEILKDREQHKTNCVSPLKSLLKYCLGSSVKAGFTQGMVKQMGCLWAMGYMWEVKGCCWEMHAAAIVHQSFFNLSCSPNKTALFLVFINPQTNTPALRKLVL